MYISPKSFRREQFESCSADLSRVIYKEAVWKLRCISLKNHLQGSSLKVAVHISQESFKRKQYESCGVHISQESFTRKEFESCSADLSRVIYKEVVWKLQCRSLKSHLQGSSLKVAVQISQESFTRKQFESCGAYLSRVIYKEAVWKLRCMYISRVI